MRISPALIAAAYFGVAVAALPPSSDEEKAKAADAAAKAAWTDKVGLYKVCVAEDRAAEAYRTGLKAAGKEVPKPVTTAPCTDPGAYVSPLTPVASKPLEASGAHSPPGTASSPPSTKTPAQRATAN